MLLRSEEKIMRHTSARFHVIVLFTWIITDARGSKNIQKNIKFVWKIRIHHRPDKHNF